MMHILVTGANGQLAKAIQAVASDFSVKLTMADRFDMDYADLTTIDRFFANTTATFDWCINCAAYTAVDLAETHAKQAQQVNATAVKYLHDKVVNQGGRFLHISTDFVFDGKKTEPYVETDICNPLSVYGKTKRAGEELLENTDAVIVRTSWLYAANGKNFLNTMLRLGASKPMLTVVDDQQGAPTWCNNLAVALLKSVVKNILAGIYHCSNTAATNWCGFAQKIMELSELNCEVQPIPTTDYPTPAERPKYSVLDNQKLAEAIDWVMPHWEDALKACLKTK